MSTMSTVCRHGKESRSLTHKNDHCVGCGICVDMCPTEAIRLGPVMPVARGLLEADLININQKECCLCGLCAASCPFDALEFNLNGKNSKELGNYPQWTHNANIDSETCIYCGRCETACPQDAIYLKRVLPTIDELVRGETDIDKDKCIYCGICEEMCPANAIEIEFNQINSNNPQVASDIKIDESKCIYCSICKRVCPESAIKIVCTTCMSQEDIIIPEIEGNIILDDKKCINCGWCQEICPVDAAQVIKPFEGEIFYVDDFECKGDSCHACADVCPCNAISMVDNRSVVNPVFCTLCGACAKACPQKGIVIKRSSMKLKNIKSKSWNDRLGGLLHQASQSK